MLDIIENGRLLIAVASDGEFRAVLAGLGIEDREPPASWKSIELNSMSILNTGVGKSNAAGAVSRQLTLAEGENKPFTKVLSIGLCGSYDASLELGKSVLGLDHILLDEGTISSEGWVTLEKSGWSRTVIKAKDGPLLQALSGKVDFKGNVGTVSTISGTDKKMEQYKKRFEVLIEVMESAAIAEVCDKFGVEYGDVRIISNYCGKRTEGSHDFPGALRNLANLTREIFSDNGKFD